MSQSKGVMKIRTGSEIYHSGHAVSFVSLFSAARSSFSVPAQLQMLQIYSIFPA